MKTFLLVLLTGLCGCVQRPHDSSAWSPNPAHRGKALFEGARVGWHASALDDGS